jgi:hypothetical protein
MTDENNLWQPAYTYILIWNAVLVVIFFLITQWFSN